MKLEPPQQTAINAALSTTEATKNSIKDYQDTIGAINHLIQQAKKDKKFSPEDFKDELSRQQTNLNLALAEQHKEETKNLTALLATPQFQNELKTSNPSEDFEKLKANLLKSLETAQKEQKDAITKVIDNEKSAMHKADQMQREMDFFLAFIAANNPKNFAMLEEKSDISEINAGNTVASTKKNTPELIGKIRMEQIEAFTTGTDKRVVASATGFTVKSSNYGFAITQSDADAVAMAVRAKLVADGVDPDPKSDKFSITMKVHHDKPEQAKQLAEKAFLACRRAGFSPSKIKIEVNGKLDEQFSKKPDNDGVKAWTDSYNPQRQMATEMKEAIKIVREEQKKAAAATPAQPTPGAVPAGPP